MTDEIEQLIDDIIGGTSTWDGSAVQDEKNALIAKFDALRADNARLAEACDELLIRLPYFSEYDELRNRTIALLAAAKGDA
jgi:hypothetical protein